jgi:cytochrome P450
MDRLICGLADREQMDVGGVAALELGIRLRGYLDAPSPAGSILAELKAAIAENEISADDGVGILLQLVTAGTETTATLIGHAVRQLGADSPRQEELRRQPGEIPDFLEGVLRDDGPFQFHSRTARQGATLGDAELPAGSLVLLMWASANRTARRSGPEDNAPSALASHVAFGRGIHFCIGAHLARMEAAVVLETLLTSRTSFTNDPDQDALARASLMMARPTCVPVRWQLD